MSPKLPRLARPGIWICSVVTICALAPAGGSAQESPGVPTCFGEPATIAYPDTHLVRGTAEADVIVTDSRPQLIDVGAGDDRVCAGGGADVIGGGLGNDKIRGEAGRDNIAGGPGDDRLKGLGGTDLLNGNRGEDDRCFGGGSFDLASSNGCERIRSAVTRL
jgi:hypothetical protein